MKRSVKSLVGFAVGATDGEIGKVREFYFDDETWTIRYLIVDTGNWLSGRVVLISPEAVQAPNFENKIFPVNLTKEQVKNSPDINTHLPVSRQEEIKLRTYYPWVSYWAGGYSGGGLGAFEADPMAAGLPVMISEEAPSQKFDENDKHLRSTAQVTGYNIKATDGEIGEVEDFLIDDINWKIDFMLIDTGHWLPEKKVLISPEEIKEIAWQTSTVIIDSTVEHVKNSPAYDPQQEMTVEYTLAHRDYYHGVAS